MDEDLDHDVEVLVRRSSGDPTEMLQKSDEDLEHAMYLQCKGMRVWDALRRFLYKDLK